MKPGLEAVIISVNEPQLTRCLESVNKQNIPFQKISHYNGIVPEYEAHNIAVKNLEYEWAMFIGGDFILDVNASQLWDRYFQDYKREDNISEFNFGLRDPFIQKVICCCTVARSEAFQRYPFENSLANDTINGSKMKRDGWERIKLFRQKVTVGTHFEDPDEFQVFRRFYARGVKAGLIKKKEVLNRYCTRFHRLKEKTGDVLYETAIRAMEIGYRKKLYPSSHDIRFERQLFEGVKNGQ
jgi:hypothetical protein